jgi:hypothetical protein
MGAEGSSKVSSAQDVELGDPTDAMDTINNQRNATFTTFHKGTQLGHVHLCSLHFGWHDLDGVEFACKMAFLLELLVKGQVQRWMGRTETVPGQSTNFAWQGANHGEWMGGIESVLRQDRFISRIHASWWRLRGLAHASSMETANIGHGTRLDDI